MKRLCHSVLAGLFLLSHGAHAGERFFPLGVWGKQGSSETQAWQDEFYENWFGSRLRQEKEKPLWVHRAKAHAVLSIRMSVFRSLVTNDFAMVRLAVMPDGSMTYYARDYDFCPVRGKPKVLDPDCLKLVDGKGTVEPRLAARIATLVERIAPLTGKTPSQIDDAGLDGTETVFEFAGDGKFNVFKRWQLSPENGGDLGDLEEVLIEVRSQVWNKN